MFTITTIPNNITIGRDLPPTSPAVRLDERGIQVNGARPLDLAPGESTIVEYPISPEKETPIRRLRCKVTREVPPEFAEQIKEAFCEMVLKDEASDQTHGNNRTSNVLERVFGPNWSEMRCLPPPETPSSLAATIERAREASENAPVPRRGGRRSARRSES